MIVVCWQGQGVSSASISGLACLSSDPRKAWGQPQNGRKALYPRPSPENGDVCHSGEVFFLNFLLISGWTACKLVCKHVNRQIQKSRLTNCDLLDFGSSSF